MKSPEVTVKGSQRVKNIKKVYFQCVQESKILEKTKIFHQQIKKKNKYLEEKQLNFQGYYNYFSLFTVKQRATDLYDD